MAWRVGKVQSGDHHDPQAVYVARAGYGFAASPLANPYRLDPRWNREEQWRVLSDYGRWLWRLLQTDTPQRREVARLAALPNGLLVCYCRSAAEEPNDGNRCHADIIIRAIEWYRKPEAQQQARERLGEANHG